MKKVAVLGCGISGLMAAWACEEMGIDYAIFDAKPKKPSVFGFMFLHKPCGIPLKASKLRQLIVPNDISISQASYLYSKKVYDSEFVESSLSSVIKNSVLDIYDMSKAINFLWARCKDKVEQKVFADIGGAVDFSKSFDLTFFTLPLNKLDSSGTYYYTDSFVLTGKVGYGDNFVFYDLRENNPLAYRWGYLFDHIFIESRLKLSGSRKVKKVVFSENLPEVPGNFILCGRYGAWDKKVLVHNVYEKVREILNG